MHINIMIGGLFGLFFLSLLWWRVTLMCVGDGRTQRLLAERLCPPRRWALRHLATGARVRRGTAFLSASDETRSLAKTSSGHAHLEKGNLTVSSVSHLYVLYRGTRRTTPLGAIASSAPASVGCISKGSIRVTRGRSATVTGALLTAPLPTKGR
jgi:hypothetical protein